VLGLNRKSITFIPMFPLLMLLAKD
jgi:hypothetical protein